MDAFLQRMERMRVEDASLEPFGDMGDIDTIEGTRAADDALCALECAVLYGHRSYASERVEELATCKSMLSVHVLSHVMQTLAQGGGVEAALRWLCACRLAQPETRRLLARRASAVASETAVILEGLRAHEGLAWERQRLVFEAALRGGHHARADAMLWGALARSNVLKRDDEAVQRLRASVARYASDTHRLALDAHLLRLDAVY